MWKKRLQILLWCLLGFSCMVLLVAAMRAKDSKTCSDVSIDIDNHGEKIFINESDIAEVLKANNVAKGVALDAIHPALVEKELKKNAWIRDAQLFFDNNQALTVKISERQPIARVFTVDGSSFYLDTAGNKLPLSEKFSARVPVFTSFPSDKKAMNAEDSTVFQGVRAIAEYVQQDSFWAAQVAQVDITPQHTYEMIPVLGNQVIKLGDGEDIDAKFKRLFVFYKKVWSKGGFEKYDTVDVRFEGQVVASRRGETAASLDSSLALQNFATGTTGMSALAKDSSTAMAGAERRSLPGKDTAAARHTVAATTVTHNAKPAVATNKPKAQMKPQAKGGKGKRRARR